MTWPRISRNDRLTSWGRWLSIACLVLALIGAGWGLALVRKDLAGQREFVAAEKERARQKVEQALVDVGERLRSLMPLGERIASGLESGELDHRRAAAEMERIIRENPQVYELGLASEPGTVDPSDLGSPSFSPSFDRKRGTVAETERSTYDYREEDNPDTEWYREAIERTEPFWQEPYCDQLSCYAEYAIPFKVPGRDEVAGVVYINMHPRDLDRLFVDLGLSATGYGMIFSKTGRIVSHRDRSLRRASIFEVAERNGDEALAEMARSAIRGEAGVVDHLDPETGKSSWIFYGPIESGEGAEEAWSIDEWSMAVVYISDDVLRKRDALFYKTRLKIGLLLLASIFFFGAAVSLRLHPRFGVATLWGLSILTSLLLVVAIGFIWREVLDGVRDPELRAELIAKQDPEATKLRRERLLHQSKVDAYLEEYSRPIREAGKELPIRIETGIFLQSMEFQSSYNVFVTGHVWQRVPNHVDPEVAGFSLPEAIGPSIEQVYDLPLPDRDSDGVSDGRRIGWHFEAVLRQTFDYSEYPFDDKSVWIRMWPRELDSNVVLSPLFASYSIIKPSEFPGLESDFVLPGWKLKETYFSYRLNSYNVDFGFPLVRDVEELPELYFHVDMRRDFMNAFISNLIPLISVVLILYTVLLIVTYQASLAEKHGFNTAGILGATAALFFSVLVGHLELRSRFEVEEVMYLEYFYFVVYLLVLGVSVDALAFCWSEDDDSLIRRNDNLLVKLLYWPVILGALCAITLWTFT